MSESLPITTPPRRRIDNPTNMDQLNHSSESCKNTPNIGRKMDLNHRHILENGSQSAKSSPLPHRRLDKLEGVIRDKPPNNIMRRSFDVEYEPSPIISRKIIQQACSCEMKTSEMKNSRRNTDFSCTNRDETRSPAMTRRRTDSDCGCVGKKVKGCNCLNDTMTKSDCQCPYTPVMKKRDLFGSPAKSVLGEPGVFSSPIHRPIGLTEQSSFTGFGSPAKSVLGEPGIFASPARSVCLSPCGDDDDGENDNGLQSDQTVVSGWLKFRDNKRVSSMNIDYDFLNLKN